MLVNILFKVLIKSGHSDDIGKKKEVVLVNVLFRVLIKSRHSDDIGKNKK